MLELEEKLREKYPLVVKSWQNNFDNLSNYFKYSCPVRKLIYTTNPIEQANQEKTNGSFTSTNALYKQIL